MEDIWKIKAEKYLERIESAAKDAAYNYCEPPLQDEKIYRSGSPYLNASHGLVRRSERARSQGVGGASIVERIIWGVVSALAELESQHEDNPDRFKVSPKEHMTSKKRNIHDVRCRYGDEPGISELVLDSPDYGR